MLFQRCGFDTGTIQITTKTIELHTEKFFKAMDVTEKTFIRTCTSFHSSGILSSAQIFPKQRLRPSPKGLESQNG